MRNPVKFRIDRREFDRTLQEYVKYTGRTHAVICNTKAFYILRRATLETPKASKAIIKSDLMQIGRLGAPIAALLVNQGRHPGLRGPEMKRAISDLIKSRRVATLRAGYVQGIKDLEPYAEKRGAPKMDRAAKQFGQPKGFGKPATEGWVCKSIFANLAGAKWDTKQTADAKAMPALQRAFDAEERSTKDYIERKQREAAEQAGVKHN
jgi:hypothetical protein